MTKLNLDGKKLFVYLPNDKTITMAYFVLHSTDPFLLARMATDLQLAGIDSDDEWNDEWNPFSDTMAPISFLHIENTIFMFHNHGAGSDSKYARFTLTESNYETVLIYILCEK